MEMEVIYQLWLLLLFPPGRMALQEPAAPMCSASFQLQHFSYNSQEQRWKIELCYRKWLKKIKKIKVRVDTDM